MTDPYQNNNKLWFSPGSVIYVLYVLIPFHRLYETVIELSGHHRKEGGTKREISVQLNAGKTKKYAPTLPT